MWRCSRARSLLIESERRARIARSGLERDAAAEVEVVLSFPRFLREALLSASCTCERYMLFCLLLTDVVGHVLQLALLRLATAGGGLLRAAALRGLLSGYH